MSCTADLTEQERRLITGLTEKGGQINQIAGRLNHRQNTVTNWQKSSIDEWYKRAI